MPKLDQKILARFNQPDTVLVISKYPFQDVAASHHGVAMYTQKVLRAISKAEHKRFVVLVQNEYGRKVELDTKNILIVPAFSSSLLMFAQLLHWIHTFSLVKLVHLHSEFYTSGNPLQMAFVVPFLALLGLLRKKVFFTAHNVVDNFSFIASHLGKKKNDFVLKTLEKLTPWYYLALALAVTKIVCLDESVKQRLAQYMPSSKLLVSPLWIEPQKKNKQNRRELRRKLGFKSKDLVIICFGFMTKYKGVDWLVETMANIHTIHGQQVKLVLAGGKAPSQSGKLHYENFYQQLTRRVAQLPNVILTDFIPENEVAHYFDAADLAVLPYRGILGASASWGQALATGTPFILSEELAPYLESDDIQTLLSEMNISKETLIFKRKRSDFIKKITQTLQPHQHKNLVDFSSHLAELRSPNVRIPLEMSAMYINSSQPVQWDYVVKPTKALAALWNR